MIVTRYEGSVERLCVYIGRSDKNPPVSLESSIIGKNRVLVLG